MSRLKCFFGSCKVYILSVPWNFCRNVLQSNKLHIAQYHTYQYRYITPQDLGYIYPQCILWVSLMFPCYHTSVTLTRITQLKLKKKKKTEEGMQRRQICSYMILCFEMWFEQNLIFLSWTSLLTIYTINHIWEINMTCVCWPALEPCGLLYRQACGLLVYLSFKFLVNILKLKFFFRHFPLFKNLDFWFLYWSGILWVLVVVFLSLWFMCLV